MPKCAKCGAKASRRDLTADGLCSACLQKRNQETLRNNYQYCLDGTARPGVLRIYRAFAAKYPDALVTGVCVLDHDERLLLYLDGKPAYYATFDPLTSSVNLVKYGASDPLPSSEPQRQYGISTFFAIVALLYSLVIFSVSTTAGIISVVASLVALAGSFSRSRSAVMFGAVFLLLPLAFESISIVNILFSVFMIVSVR